MPVNNGLLRASARNLSEMAAKSSSGNLCVFSAHMQSTEVTQSLNRRWVEGNAESVVDGEERTTKFVDDRTGGLVWARDVRSMV